MTPPQRPHRGARPTYERDERRLLEGWLDFHRETLIVKCDGLGDDQRKARPISSSLLSLHGLVRHLADVERHWFRRVLAGQDIPWLYRRDDDRDGAFNDAVADPVVVESAWAVWREEVRFAERFVEEAPNFELAGSYGRGTVISLCEVLVHMIEEYVRHAGHDGFLRERIDVRVGQ